MTIDWQAASPWLQQEGSAGDGAPPTRIISPSAPASSAAGSDSPPASDSPPDEGQRDTAESGDEGVGSSQAPQQRLEAPSASSAEARRGSSTLGAGAAAGASAATDGGVWLETCERNSGGCIGLA